MRLFSSHVQLRHSESWSLLSIAELLPPAASTGFDGLTVRQNTITSESVPSTTQLSASLSPSQASVEHAHSGLCGDVCGSFDGFDISHAAGARVNGWAVDVKLLKPNISSYVMFEVDGKAVMTVLADALRPDLVGPVAKEPQHGFDALLPATVATQLLSGNHTLSVSARRQDGSMAQLNKRLYCVNKERLSCHFPEDCSCGAKLPSRLFISNSIACAVDSNTCEGKPCASSDPTGGCKA